ncbi:BRO-like protein [Colwellia sp. D2M02]|uniref:BRO-N domain-containing protein n=1 Tax=Colwellia sp. D2M02 TaxID=2841562 RepID=UPI001C0901F1|nr:BRO family protein [Colwellia sp. D2M02]MBU2892443.1 BRO-like protein [Colwellia sp. D2M02]
MNNDLMLISYQGEGEPSNIRTLYKDNILYISLKDLLITLNRENKEINSSHIAKSMASIIKAQLSNLEQDEYLRVPVRKPSFQNETEIFVNQPGLYRVLSSDKSAAGKKFQNWLYKEVVPSLAKHGVYPAPDNNTDDQEIEMAKMLAQNSQLLLNTMQKQKSLEKRVEKLEDSPSNDNFYFTVTERLNQLNINGYPKERITHIVAWCEKLIGTSTFTFKKCASGERLNTLFPQLIIDNAIDEDNKRTWK